MFINQNFGSFAPIKKGAIITSNKFNIKYPNDEGNKPRVFRILRL